MWNWVYKKELPKENKPLITLKWNCLSGSSECQITYEVDSYENGFLKDAPYHRTVAWQYIERPQDIWQFLGGGR